MQTVSSLYQSIISGDYSVETRVAVGEPGRLVTKNAEPITFGGYRISVGISGADAGYDESMLYNVQTTMRVFSDDTPMVGACVSGELDITMIKPVQEIPRRGMISLYARVKDGTRYSEWIPKGVFFVDTREEDGTVEGEPKLTLHCYDAMIKAEADYPSSKLSWPAKDINVVKEIANAMDITVDARTTAIMTKGYTVQFPSDYSQRETLGYIAAMYAGCFVITDAGELRLVQLNGIPKETRYLVNRATGSVITFGGVRIIV